MASPTVESEVDTLIGANLTTHTVNYPATVSPGATILHAGVLDDDNNATTWQAGFNELVNVDTSSTEQMTFIAAWEKADGTEDGGTFDFFVAGGEQSFSNVWSITGAADPDTNAPEANVSARADGTSPDPPSLTPTGGAKDYLYFAIIGASVEDVFTGFPSGYTGTGSGGGGGGNASLGWAHKATTGSTSEDPGVFTLSASRNWFPATFAIYPTGVAPSAAIMNQLQYSNLGSDLFNGTLQ